MKRLTPYIKRADELQAEDPLASFYCRTYVVEQLIALNDASLQALALDQLELAENLKSSSLPPDINTNGGPEQFKLFCQEVFEAAEASASDTGAAEAAMRYYFSSLFFDVLSQFGPLSTEEEAKRTKARRMVVELRRGGTFFDERRILGETIKDLERGAKDAALDKLKEVIRKLEA